MNRKAKFKPKRDRYRLDFVTSHTIDECRAILQQASAGLAPDWQRIFLHDDNSFIIERLVTLPVLLQTRYSTTVEVSIKGTLIPAGSGTRVQGTVPPEFYEQLHSERFALFVGIGGIAIFAGLLLILRIWGFALLILALLVGVWAFMRWRWREIRWYPVDIQRWVHQQLENDEPQKQA